MSVIPTSTKKKYATTIIYFLSAEAFCLILMFWYRGWPAHVAISVSILFGAVAIVAAILDVFGERGDVRLVGPPTPRPRQRGKRDE